MDKIKMKTWLVWECEECGNNYGEVKGDEEWVFCSNEHENKACRMQGKKKIVLSN